MSSSNWLVLVTSIGWGGFWLVNGLDKFLNRGNEMLFGQFAHQGSRDFQAALTDIGLQPAASTMLLEITGFWEIVIAMPFLGAALYALSAGCEGEYSRMRRRAVELSGLTLLLYCGFYLFATDRGELLEHGAYLAALFVCCVMTFPTLRAQQDGVREGQGSSLPGVPSRP